jgi:hypothetical protein
LNADPDPATQINADPCGSGYGSGSETLVGRLRSGKRRQGRVAGKKDREGWETKTGKGDRVRKTKNWETKTGKGDRVRKRERGGKRRQGREAG